MRLSLRNTIRYRLRGWPEPKTLVAQGLRLGRDVYLAPGVVIDPWHCWLVSIGDGTTLAPEVHVLAHDASTKAELGWTKIGRVEIGSRVFIGAGSVILPGVQIGDGAIIGAGSVVRTDIPAGVVAAGNPVEVMGSADDYLARQSVLLEQRPRFGTEFTAQGGVTSAQKQELRDAVRDGIAFIR